MRYNIYMSVGRPVTYRAYTWGKIAPRLLALTDVELQDLVERAQVAISAGRDEQIKLLLKRGGFLIIEFGLASDPGVTAGTFFMEDIHEYVIDDEAAAQLAKRDDVTVRHPGGDIAAIYTYDELISALKTSEVFDQIEQRK